MRRVSVGLVLGACVFLAGSTSEYFSAKQKLDAIGGDKLKPGSRVSLSPSELNAYIQQELVNLAIEGLRNPKVELGAGKASGTALIDFVKLRGTQGKPPNWFMARLLSGERPVRVTAGIRSGAGRATVDVRSVEISGLSIDGAVLDFLIEQYLLPRYPTAKIGEPFDLGHRIDHLDVKPSAVGVVIAK